jgi:hypothetical protein
VLTNAYQPIGYPHRHADPGTLNFDKDGAPTSLWGDRYKFWVYQQLRKRIEVGDIYIDDSVQPPRLC